MSMTVKPTAGSPGFSPPPTALTMSRNRKGRFSGTPGVRRELRRFLRRDQGPVRRPPEGQGRVGHTWDDTVKDPDGGSRRFDYALTGRVARRVGRGTLRIALTGTDAAGAKTLSCDSGGVSWKATTG
jgi:hypothetical protein